MSTKRGHHFTLLIDIRQSLFRIALMALLEKNRQQWRLIDTDDPSLKSNGGFQQGVLIFHIQNPFGDEFLRVKTLVSNLPQLQIVILTDATNPTVIDYFFAQLPISAFISKFMDGRELLKALDVIEGGGRYLNPIMIEAYSRISGTCHTQDQKQFTERELELIKLLSLGNSTKEIAKAMHITVSATESYRKALLKKTKTKNTAELIAFAFQSGILEI